MPKNPTITVVFETRSYEFAHGRAPKGYGSWAFDAGQGPEFMPASTYADAKKAFVALLRGRLSVTSPTVVSVEVCS